ncbi:MAG TPA: VOC family protein [Candidatus Elarobacter sp.]
MDIQGIHSSYYTVRDADALTKFYSAFLGEPVMHMPGRFTEWNFGDGTSFGLYGTPDAEAGSSGSVMFGVADLPKALDELRALGVTLHGDGEITDTPVCTMAFGEDPEGNQFIVHSRKG